MPFAAVKEGSMPWNKEKLVGQKAPLKPPEVWAIRVRLQLADKKRVLALFNLAVDSKLRGCDLLRITGFRFANRRRNSPPRKDRPEQDRQPGSIRSYKMHARS